MAYAIKHRGRWQGRYRLPDGTFGPTKTFIYKAEALAWASDQEAAIRRGEDLDLEGGKTTFGVYATTWRAAQMHAPSTQDSMNSVFKNHILPTFGDVELRHIRKTMIQAWVKGRTGVLKPRTIQTAFSYLSSVLKAAVEDRYIPKDPSYGTKLPPIEKEQVVPLVVPQVRAWEEATSERYRAMVTLAAGTGLRISEVLGLTVDRIDFLRKVVKVDRQLIKVNGRAPFLAPPKTEASKRTVPLSGSVIAALALHLRQFPAHPQEVEVTDDHRWWKEEVTLVFTNLSGRPIQRGGIGNIVNPAVAKAGLPAGTTFHDLRHHYASLLIHHGQSVKVVQANLGHASAQETLDTYSHLWPDSEDESRAAVEVAWSDQPPIFGDHVVTTGSPLG
jgi:integrase